MAPDTEPNTEALLQSGMFAAIVNEILLAHDFLPHTAIFRWNANSDLMLMAVRSVARDEAAGSLATDVS